jgi:hypothetical protein
MNDTLSLHSFILAVLVSTNLAAQVTITPTMRPAPPGTLITVNNGPGDHTIPRVSGDLVTYTNDPGFGNTTIRYFNIASMTDNSVPPGFGTVDFLSDVSGQTIVFTRSSSTADIFSFDTSAPNTLTEIAPQTGSERFGAQIGTTTIAWQDFGVCLSGTFSDIFAYDRATGSTTRLTSDCAANEAPAISADGSVISWNKCASPTAPCDIWSAVRTATGWITHQLTNGAGNCRHPDTNGQVAVYACDRGSGDHLFWQPVTGGVEFALGGSLAQETLPSVSGQFIAFSGLPSGATNHNIYVLDLTTFNLFQMPIVTGDHTFNDIAITPAGKVNVAWQVLQSSWAVYAYTFNTPSIADALTDLGNLIDGFGLPHGTANSLIAKVNAAQASLAAGNTADTCDQLQALINDASAQSGKKLTVDQAKAIIAAAEAIRAALGCP